MRKATQRSSTISALACTSLIYQRVSVCSCVHITDAASTRALSCTERRKAHVMLLRPVRASLFSTASAMAEQTLNIFESRVDMGIQATTKALRASGGGRGPLRW